MLTKKQLLILDVFRKNLGKKIMFNQIKRETKIKSNSFLQRTIMEFKEESIINSEKVGRSILYWLNLNNKTFSYFSIINLDIYKLPEKILVRIINEISKKTLFFIVVVFGSYAKQIHKKDSDLDIALIVDNSKDVKKIMPVIETIKRREIIKIDCYIFTVEEFKEMLNSEKENVGKEILRNHIAFYNINSFYRLVEKWIH
ncbi:MAG: nucleotidyltransferase domain-containing protein [Nanoarchaeota archaeon]|nr:nucleotidyltransferase domain-containing protein [Nanoarchaeota archaeon]